MLSSPIGLFSSQMGVSIHSGHKTPLIDSVEVLLHTANVLQAGKNSLTTKNHFEDRDISTHSANQSKKSNGDMHYHPLNRWSVFPPYVGWCFALPIALLPIACKSLYYMYPLMGGHFLLPHVAPFSHHFSFHHGTCL